MSALNNALRGSVYFLDGANAPSWLSYDTESSCWNAAIASSTPLGLTEIETMQSNFEIKNAEGGSYPDKDGNKVVIKEKVTGKLVLTGDPGIIGNLKKNRQGKKVNIVLIDRDSAAGDYAHQVVPYFSNTTKIGEVMTVEMTFEYEAGANIPPQNERRRIFNIVSLPA